MFSEALNSSCILSECTELNKRDHFIRLTNWDKDRLRGILKLFYDNLHTLIANTLLAAKFRLLWPSLITNHIGEWNYSFKSLNLNWNQQRLWNASNCFVASILHFLLLLYCVMTSHFNGIFDINSFNII